MSREITGDELIASDAARVAAARIEQENPFPYVSDEESPEEYVARWKEWQARSGTTEKSLRDKAAHARKAIAGISAILESDDHELFPSMRATMAQALTEARIYESYAWATLQLACRKYPTRADTGMEAAILQLYCKGVKKAQIARLLGRDRREITRSLTGADAIVATMREHLGLRAPMGE